MLDAERWASLERDYPEVADAIRRSDLAALQVEIGDETWAARPGGVWFNVHPSWKVTVT